MIKIFIRRKLNSDFFKHHEYTNDPDMKIETINIFDSEKVETERI